MNRRPPSTAARTVTVRCTQVRCRSVRLFRFMSWADRLAVLTANQADPWQCGNHPQERRAAA